jgi:hypothetical protein
MSSAGLLGLWWMLAAGPAAPDVEPPGEGVATDEPVAEEGAERTSAEPPSPAEGSEAPPEQTPPAMASTHDVPADDFEREPGIAPGGYYGHGVILERAPPDGRKQIVLGSILVPLGILAAVSSGVGAWMTVPRHCVRRMSALGAQIDDPSQCRGLFTYNVINASYGVLMLTSGAVIMGIGLVKRERYRKWRAAHGLKAWLVPGRRSAMAGVGLRF